MMKRLPLPVVVGITLTFVAVVVMRGYLFERSAPPKYPTRADIRQIRVSQLEVENGVLRQKIQDMYAERRAESEKRMQTQPALQEGEAKDVKHRRRRPALKKGEARAMIGGQWFQLVPSPDGGAPFRLGPPLDKDGPPAAGRTQAAEARRVMVRPFGYAQGRRSSP